jgi:hypothetical protein
MYLSEIACGKLIESCGKLMKSCGKVCGKTFGEI